MTDIDNIVLKAFQFSKLDKIETLMKISINWENIKGNNDAIFKWYKENSNIHIDNYLINNKRKIENLIKKAEKKHPNDRNFKKVLLCNLVNINNKKLFMKNFTEEQINNIILMATTEMKLFIIKSIMTNNLDYLLFIKNPNLGNKFDMYGNEITDTYVQTNTYPEDLDSIKKEILQFYNSQVSA